MQKDMKQNILNYSDEIITIDSFVEAVRKIPGMYIGRTGNPGFLNMIREVFQNSVDELIKNESPCDYIIVSYDENSNGVVIEDNGRGIPFGRLIDVFANQHTSSNYEKKEGEFSSGRHGVGAKVTNALSSVFTVESYILGDARKVEFIDGIPKKGEVKIPNKTNKQGTMVYFVPCREVMGNITVTYEEVFRLIESIFRLTPIGSRMRFNAITKAGHKLHEDIINEGGIMDYLVDMTETPLVKPIILQNYTGVMKADIAFTFDSNLLAGESVLGFANLCPTVAGTHMDGLTKGITKYFVKYMNSIYLKNNKVQCVPTDIRSTLKAVISAAHLNPDFTGQAKDILGNEDMEQFIVEYIPGALDEWFKHNPSDLQRLCKQFKQIADIRLAETKEKIKITSKNTSIITGMPEKYVKPNKQKRELHIVEGDSAKGSAKDGRDKDTQAIFPIRGKLPNAFTTSRSKFLDNQEIKDMILIFGGGYGQNFDITKVPWEKVIIDTDADPDGAHIRALVLKFILLYCRPLIEHGRLFASVPPLYGVEVRGKMKYFTTRLDFIKYIQKDFSKNNTLCNLKGKPYTTSEVTSILYRNADFIDKFDKIRNTFAIDPYLLELTLNNLELSYASFKKIIEKTFRFLKVSKQNGLICIDGNATTEKIQTVILNDRLIQFCEPVMKYLKESEQYYILNGKQTSLYGLMSAFVKSSPSKVTYYKGLGEMDADQLRDSTLSYDNRTLIKYTTESINEEINAIRNIESNRHLLLNNLK